MKKKSRNRGRHKSGLEERYRKLVLRHLHRELLGADGLSEAEITRGERRLGIRLPQALREYYRLAGRLDQLNRAHNRLLPPNRLRIKDGHLWFMEENQSVAHWGIPVQTLQNQDPTVYQRAAVQGASWFSENLKFSTFLIRMYDWQAGLAAPH
jgi:hypothetical protein